MEAFQLSLGRSADFDLTRITFNDANVETGKGLFLNGSGDPNAGGRCASCHNNAGALQSGVNVTINTNVELYRPNSIVKETFLPGWAGIASGVKTKIRAAYVCTVGAA